MRALRLRRRKRLDLQAKITLVLVGVILPTFLIVTIAENQLTQPILNEEMRQMGITTGKAIAKEVVRSKLLLAENPTSGVERVLQEMIYTQPNILRIDVWARDTSSGEVRQIGSTVEEDPALFPQDYKLVDELSSRYNEEASGVGQWEVIVPIESKKGTLGNVHVLVSTKLVQRVVDILWKTTAMAAGFSVVTLLLALSYFLRKTISNDRKLREAECQNVQLTEQLHEAQRQLMNTEKLAVMGQLTAQFAHEIGTPLNAIGGHLQLLKDELPPDRSLHDRMSILDDQLDKIEHIVKGFLQSTAKPTSQKQLADLNRIVEKTIGLVRPRLEGIRVELRRDLDREMGPIRVVPLEIEQILLNLVNNSLDSLAAKSSKHERAKLNLEVTTGMERTSAVVSVFDTGEGIRKADLNNVRKPFFTTKRPGEGTGLGLTICEQLAHKYGGEIAVESKEGAWTRVTLRIPYENTNV